MTTVDTVDMCGTLALANRASKKLDLKKVWLLDSQSTITLVVNPKFASRVWNSRSRCMVHGTTGKLSVRKKCDTELLPFPAWLDPRGLANIVALKQMRGHFLPRDLQQSRKEVCGAP